jgi:hypothetical protein
VIQILHFLVDKKYSKIIEKAEALKQYAYRNLRKQNNLRSQIFIRLILEMIRADFKKQGTEFRCLSLRNKLNDIPITGLSRIYPR